MGDVGGIERNRPAVGGDHAQDHAERGGLAGAVPPEHADDFPLGKNEADFVHHRATVVSFDQFCSFEKVHSWPMVRSAHSLRNRATKSSGRRVDNLWITLAIPQSKLPLIQANNSFFCRFLPLFARLA
jgi:hypothetical protein